MWHTEICVYTIADGLFGAYLKMMALVLLNKWGNSNQKSIANIIDL
jgi:hypothetical protein